MRPAPPTASSPPAPRPRGTGGPDARRRRAAVASLAGIVLVLLVGCGAAGTPGPTRSGPPGAPRSGSPGASPSGSPGSSATIAPSAFAGRLALVTGSEGARGIVAVDGHGVREQLPTPGVEPRWVSADAAGRLAATLADGSVEIEADGRWEPVPTGPLEAGRAGSLVVGATWSPDGRLAALLVDADRATGSLLVLDPADGTGDRHLLEEGLEGSPPGWLGVAEVGVPARSASDAPVLAIVDAASGRTTARIAGLRAIATALCAPRLATIDADGRVIRVWDASRRPWTPIATVDAPAGAGRAASLALDPSGARLAVGWIPADGDTAVATVHTSASGWRVVTRIPLGIVGGDPAMTWLP